MQLEKITEVHSAEPKRGYVDACGLAHALELIGERWAMLVMRELLLGPRRFSEIKADLPGISANVLTQRLTELERRGLVVKKRLAPPANVQVYEATPWGLDAGPVLCALGRWAFRSPAHDGSQPVSAVAILLSIKTNFDPNKAGDFRGTIAFRFAAGTYHAAVGDGRIEIAAGEASADATIICNPDDIKMVLYGGAPIDTLEIIGDRQAVERFVTFFSLPPKVDPLA